MSLTQQNDQTAEQNAVVLRRRGLVGFASGTVATVLGASYTMGVDYTTPALAFGAISTLLAFGGMAVGAWVAVSAGLDLTDLREAESARQLARSER